MLALILSPMTVPNVSAYRPDSLFQEQLGVREVTHVIHVGLKTEQTDYIEQCWKMVPCRVDPVECY